MSPRRFQITRLILHPRQNRIFSLKVRFTASSRSRLKFSDSHPDPSRVNVEFGPATVAREWFLAFLAPSRELISTQVQQNS